jgi:cyclic pyranopterin phosphate synthase
MNAQIATATVLPVTDALNRPLRDLRLSVIETCNFRCPYCMPEDSVPEDLLGAQKRLSFAEIETVARSFIKHGVRKIRLTGGEPLLRKNLAQLVAQLKAIIGLEDLALTTNGSLLAAQALALKHAGLDRITVSVDALDATIFKQMSGGRGDIATVLQGIDAAKQAGFKQIKINCVVQRGVNESQMLPLLDYCLQQGHVLRFIEFMDVGSCNNWQASQVFSVHEMHALITSKYPLQALGKNVLGEVAERYAVNNGVGEVGFIASVSKPFCGDCNRARLSADGKLFTCLFASAGFDLRALIKQPENLDLELASLWRHRADRYSEIRHAAVSDRKKIEMYFIGG